MGSLASIPQSRIPDSPVMIHTTLFPAQGYVHYTIKPHQMAGSAQPTKTAWSIMAKSCHILSCLVPSATKLSLQPILLPPSHTRNLSVCLPDTRLLSRFHCIKEVPFHGALSSLDFHTIPSLHASVRPPCWLTPSFSPSQYTCPGALLLSRCNISSSDLTITYCFKGLP